MPLQTSENVHGKTTKEPPATSSPRPVLPLRPETGVESLESLKSRPVEIGEEFIKVKLGSPEKLAPKMTFGNSCKVCERTYEPNCLGSIPCHSLRSLP